MGALQSLLPRFSFHWVRAAVMSVALVNVGGALADEVPLGGSTKTIVARFNAAAERLKLDVRLTGKSCPTPRVCDLELGGGIEGHMTAVSPSNTTLETMLFVHDCSVVQAVKVKQAAKVFVSLFSKGAVAGDDKLAALERAVETNNDRKSVVTIEGVEFTNSAISCSLLVARPLVQR